MIRLLDKKSVNVQVAIEKKKQIDSGIKLASKVDAVRETLLEEEERLAKFRSETIARTQVEIDAKIKEKDGILAQIKARKEELLELRKPLDEEWEMVNSGRSELNELQVMLLQKDSELDQGIALNIQRERLNKEEEQRIASERERTCHALTEADLMREMASGILVSARTKADDVISNAQRKDETSGKRELAVEVREREVAKEASRLRKIEKQQKDNERAIADKYETLARTINRTKK